MKAGFVLVAGILVLMYLASRKVTTQTSVNLDYNPDDGLRFGRPQQSQLDQFFSNQNFGLTDTQRIFLSIGDDESAWLTV